MILLTFLSFLSFSICIDGKPLPASGRQESHALYARQDPLPVPENPDAGSPMCPVNTLANILDGAKCNSGDDILISGPPQKYPDPPPVKPEEIKDFTGLAGAVNAASAGKENLPVCKRETQLPDSYACRDQEPDQWVLELDPDQDSKMGLTVEMSAGDACPYTRLPDYKYLSGPKQGKVENATLIDIYHDVNNVDNEVWRQAAEQELDGILSRNDEVFQKYWGMSVYDYAMINGTSLDPRKITKRASVEGSIQEAEASDGGGPPPEADENVVAPPVTANVATAIHKKGDMRLFLFGTSFATLWPEMKLTDTCVGYLPIFMGEYLVSCDSRRSFANQNRRRGLRETFSSKSTGRLRQLGNRVSAIRYVSHVRSSEGFIPDRVLTFCLRRRSVKSSVYRMSPIPEVCRHCPILIFEFSCHHSSYWSPARS